MQQGAGLASERDKSKVYIIDDDPLMLSSLEATLASAGYAPEKFVSAGHFLHCVTAAQAGCVLTDYRMPDLDGIALQEELARRESPLSVIILTGYADVALAVRAIKGGAIDILEKPFERNKLLADVAVAIGKSRENVARLQARKARDEKLSLLTARERQVVEQLIEGRTNRQIAACLGLSSRTVEIHRAHAMEKLDAANLLDLVRAVGDLH